MSKNEAERLDKEDMFIYGSIQGKNNRHQRKDYIAISSSGFADFDLKPELLRAIVNCGFKRPSTVQLLLLPQSCRGMDILYQGQRRGKKTVFIIATLQQLVPVHNQVSVLVMCFSREQAYEIKKKYERFSKYMPNITVGIVSEGIAIEEKKLMTNCPHIIVGTPGRILALVKNKKLNLRQIKHVIINDYDKILEFANMKMITRDIFTRLPTERQVIIFCSSNEKSYRPICKDMMRSEKYTKGRNRLASYNSDSEFSEDDDDDEDYLL